MLSHPARAFSLSSVSKRLRWCLIALLVQYGCSGSDCVSGPLCGNGDPSEPPPPPPQQPPPPDPGPGTGELVAHVGEFLRTLVGRDLSHGELGDIYSIEDATDGRFIRIPLAPGNYAFLDIQTIGEVRSLVIHDNVAYWHDQASFYWWPILQGGPITSLSTGGFIIQDRPLPAPPYIYFDEFITDRLYRIPIAGGTPEEVDVFTLGGTRGLARDENNLYWIGATDGSHLKTMPAGGGAQSTLLSGASVFLPHKLKAVPNGSGGTTLFWLDTAVNGNPVVRRFPVPGGPATSIFNAEGMIDFTVTDEAIYWWTTDYIGRWDLASGVDTYPVEITGLAIQGVTVVGDYIYYSISDGYVYRVPR